MVGGRVIEVRFDGDRDRIWCVDTTYPGDELAIYIAHEPAAYMIQPGDSVWWHGRDAFWTPEPVRYVEDRRFRRIGYSFDPRKEVAHV